MNKYSTYLKVLENKRIFEHAFNKEKTNEIERLKNAGDNKGLLNIFNNDINSIKTQLSDINFNDISIKKTHDYYIIEYNTISYALLRAFELNILKNENSEYLLNKIFQDGYRDLFLEVEIHEEMFNKIDILNGLPNFMKNLGLGKKIYKKLIKDFGYISSFSGYEPSRDSDLAWYSIAQDNEIYSFCNDNNIISFWNELPYDEITNILKGFYKEHGKMFFDDDFLSKYNLTDEQLKDFLI